MSIAHEVMNSDRQFCTDCKTGKEKAWASYFLEDGVMITGGTRDNIVGKEEIEKAMKKTFALKNVVFDWDPDYCEVSEDGTLAVTRGKSILTYINDDKEVTHLGNYTTIWKKNDNQWKISWDIGN